MPNEGTVLKFKDYLRSEKVPFIVYADFECLNKPIHSCTQEKNNDDEKSYTNKYQKHEPSSFCYYIKCFDDEVYPPVIRLYTGEDSAKKFVEMLEEDIRKIANIPPKKMIFTDKDVKDFNEAVTCWICNEEFTDIPDENGYKRNEKLKIIVILLVCIEELHIINVILNIENLILLLWCFITLVGMIVIYL